MYVVFKKLLFEIANENCNYRVHVLNTLARA